MVINKVMSNNIQSGIFNSFNKFFIEFSDNEF